ncbi:MAG: hypothetical protein LBT02_03550 [Rickettsiales bacterium]|jgi:hypothetical protein|nr:hypothetical protein [Rickettsiales bacterium]
MKKFLVLFLFFISIANADNSLLFFELQGITAWQSSDKKFVPYSSDNKYDAMQLNSIGIDFVKKFSNETRDYLTFAMQFRFAYNEAEDNKMQPQIYNLYLNYKSENSNNIWFGRNKIAYGFNSYLDTHADLLRLPIMLTEDWGVGFSKDLEHGDLRISLTTGSGMPLVFNNKILYSTTDEIKKLRGKDNYIFTVRASIGILEQNNYNAGVSFMTGNVVDSMGYKIMPSMENTEMMDMIVFRTTEIIRGAIDFNYVFDNIEMKFEADYGNENETKIFNLFYRFSINVIDELKFETQILYEQRKWNEKKENGMERVGDILEMDEKNLFFGVGAVYKINGDLTLRTMYEREKKSGEYRIVGQVYWYFGM